MEKWFLVIFFYSVSISAQTISCPLVEDIKHGNFNRWLLLYIANEELATPKDTESFRNHLQTFAFAKWNKFYLENGHCFYKGDDPILNKIVLANDAWRPEKK